jgi:DNA polymerase elongation subunit (family B)
MKKAAKALEAIKQQLQTADPSEVEQLKRQKAALETEKSIFDLKQHATKIMLNSLYGACGNQYFRFFDVKNAEAVTTTGQFIIQYVGRNIDAYLNKMMRTTGKKFVIYSDTDSI